MANLKYVRKNKLISGVYSKRRKIRAIIFIAFIAIFAVSFLTLKILKKDFFQILSENSIHLSNHSALFYIVFGVIAFILAFFISKYIHKFIKSDKSIENIRFAGADGENKMLESLKKLPKSYTIFNQVNIPDNRSTIGMREYDFIVVGNNAVFIIEVKNNHGEIYIENTKDLKEWQTVKQSKAGIRYKNPMKNPFKQAYLQQIVLKNFLYQQKSIAWIVNTICFTNDNVRLMYDGDEELMHCIGGIDEVIEHITTFKRERKVVKNRVISALAYAIKKYG